MEIIRRIAGSRYLLWTILALPLIFTSTGYVSGRLFYGEVIHASGEVSARLMILAMAATPLALMLPARKFPRWLMKNRRYIGVASFSYAFLHTIVYLQKVRLPAAIFDDAVLPEYWTGWLALLIFLVLAATSNDRSVQWLQRGWKKLHRLIYAAAILLFVHWVLVAFNRGPALAHLGLLAALETYRLWKLNRVTALSTKIRNG